MTVLEFVIPASLFAGGMQDWNYLHSNCFEITIELGCYKYPMTSDLKRFWTQNEAALIVFISQVLMGLLLTINMLQFMPMS